MRLSVYVIAVVLVLASAINAEIDYQICPTGVTPAGQDLKWSKIPSRFEIMTELVSGSDVWELSQAFSTTRDAVATNSKNGPVELYWNFLTDEDFAVATLIVNQQPVPQCLRGKINATSETSVIQAKSLFVKPSVLLGFNQRNQPNPLWGIRYVRDEDLRGIPANVFQSCFYVDDIKATVNATYHVSDVTKFHAYLPRNQSIILQLDVTIRNINGAQEVFTYNVFRYSPNPSGREERQALETPAGVYCPHRTHTLPFPADIPDRVSTNAETFVPNFNSSILSSHNLYDTEFQFSRFDVWFADPRGRREGVHFTEMHDFSTGISYQYNHLSRQCSARNISQGFNDVTTVDDNPNLFQMGDPQHLFLADAVRYQYTGEKRCRDRVLCHVWIGEKQMPNYTVQHLEWYWASNVNGEPLRQWIPMKLVMKQYVRTVLASTFELTLFNFRRNPMTIFEIDFTLADCFRALGPSENFNLGVFSFTIANDKNYSVSQNLNYLRLHIWETLTFAMFVRPIRISNIIVDIDGSDILVTFTLLDAPPFTGPVEMPIKESSLDTLIGRLSTLIDSNGLAFRAQHGTKYTVLRARANSLNTRHRSTEQKWKNTGPQITGLWIGLILVGLVGGFVGGFIVLQKFAKS